MYFKDLCMHFSCVPKAICQCKSCHSDVCVVQKLMLQKRRPTTQTFEISDWALEFHNSVAILTWDIFIQNGVWFGYEDKL